MSIMVEYDLPKWCEGCNALSTEKRYVEGIDFPHYLIREHLTCEHLNLCDALRAHWKLDEQPIVPTFGQWIPASNPPENCEDVIVCVSGRRGNILYDHAVEACDCCYEDSVWYVCGVEVDNLTIHAWMPLPEPYREERTEGRKDRRMSDTISRQAAIDALQGRK